MSNKLWDDLGDSMTEEQIAALLEDVARRAYHNGWNKCAIAADRADLVDQQAKYAPQPQPINDEDDQPADET